MGNQKKKALKEKTKMGLTNETSGKNIVSIAEGKFCLRLSDDAEVTEGVRVREGEVGGEAYSIKERVFNKLDGNLDSVEITDGEYGKNLLINMSDEDGEYTLRLTIGKQITDSIAKRMPNIDHTAPVIFRVGKDKDSGNTYVYVQQHGETVPNKFTKDEPNGLPEWKAKKSGGWNHDEYDDFLFDVIEGFAERVNS